MSPNALSPCEQSDDKTIFATQKKQNEKDLFNILSVASFNMNTWRKL